MKELREITVVGGGIGGLATALGISQLGKEVTVLEKAPQFGEVGAGIQLAPNATKILNDLGVLEEVLEYAVQPKRLVLRDVYTAKELASLDLNEQFRKRYQYPYVVVHRSDLHHILLDACKNQQNKIELRNNVDVTNIIPGKPITIETEAGQSFQTQHLVGADGLWSNTRKIFTEDEPVCSKYVAYRGTLPTEEISDHVNLDDVIMWIGPNLHLVQYPVRSGKLFNQVVVFKSYNYDPNSDNWGTPEEMDRRFKNSHPLVQTALSFIERQFRWPMYDREPLNKWVKDNIALIGDAAHPMLQYLAQGGCQALEDVATIKSELSNGADIEEAFSNY